MQLLNVTINGVQHYAVSDPYDPTLVHEFGAGLQGLRDALAFMNRVLLAEHAAEIAGFAH